MIKEAIGTGSTIDEAKENALLSLSAGPDDDVSIEVLETPKKKSLGLFGGTLAKVRAYMEEPDSAVEKEVSETSVKNEKSEEKVTAKEDENALTPADLKEGTKEWKATTYLLNILKNLGCGDVDVKITLLDGGAKITMEGEGLGTIIGRRGETLDAIQHLTSLAASTGEGGYFRVVLNTGDYRERREQTLIALAKRMSAQAIKAGKCRTLDPMNPYERRIIHTAVQEIPGVTSTSFGEGSGRRVVIAPEGVTPKPRSERREGRFDRRSGNRGQRKEKYVPENTGREQQEDALDMPLYGKIEL